LKRIKNGGDMSRKLVTIQTIDEINPIEGADRIDVASILGWELVVKKNEFQVGDKCCFFEIDSLLPDREEFEFMRDKKFRVKTIKARGQISQGLALPLSSFSIDLSSYDIGDDITEILGVKKWEPHYPNEKSVNLRSKRMSNFPYFISKTDEIIVQSMFKTLKNCNDLEFYSTEKLDGSSMTIFFLKEAAFDFPENYFGVCSRNYLLDKDETNGFWQIVIEKELEQKALEYSKSFCIQGELIGPGIQKNKYKLQNREFRVYSVFDMFNQKYLDWESIEELSNVLGLMTVPFLGRFNFDYSVKDLVDMSRGFSKLNEYVLREGIVCRHSSPDKFVSFKVIQPEFLLKHNE